MTESKSALEKYLKCIFSVCNSAPCMRYHDADPHIDIISVWDDAKKVLNGAVSKYI